jgi:hypothetical protein
MTSAANIIQGAYRKIGRNSDDRNLSDKKIAEGLNYLNLLFKSYLTNTQLIEYNEEITFNLVVGQRSYVISKEGGADVDNNMIVKLKHVNLVNQNIRYPVEIVTDVYAYKTQRDTSITQRPKWVFLQNGINFSTLDFIIKPDLTYECIVKAKFARNNILITELTDELREIPKGNYLFFEYQLAKILHHAYPGSVWNAELEATLTELKENVQSAGDIDVEIETSKALRFYGDKFTPTLGVIT